MLPLSQAPVSVALNWSSNHFRQAIGTVAGAAILAGVAVPSAYPPQALVSIALFVVSIVVSLRAKRKEAGAT